MDVIASPTTITTCSVRLHPVRSDERWPVRPRGRLPAFAAVVLMVSLALHGALLAVALLAARPVAEAAREIPVEIVQADPADAPKAAPQPPPPPPQRQAEPDPAAAQRAGLERELAALKAEQAALKADAGGPGPLRNSLQALALPSVATDGEGELVGYQSLVFSQLAKAKEAVPPTGAAGVVGVRFALDEAGRLLDVGVAVSSGNAGLDADAVAIVRRAAPFPPPPAGAERLFSANVSYAAPR